MSPVSIIQWMKQSDARRLLLCGGLLPLCLSARAAQDAPKKDASTDTAPIAKTSRLHNGWKLSPAGTHERVGDMLLGCALSPDKSTLALTNVGYNAHHLLLVDVRTGKVRQSLPLDRAWNGVAWGLDGATIYVSGGGGPRVHVFMKQSDGSFASGTAFPLPGIAANPPEETGKTKRIPFDKTQGQAYVSGLALSADGKTLYAANLASDTIFALSLPDGAVTMQRKLETNAHPYCLRLSPDGKQLFATQIALKSVAVLNTSDLSVTRTIPVEAHPNDLLFAPDGRLFVSCGNSDSVLSIDPVSGMTKERLAVTLTPRAPAGTTPDALSISPDGRTLYVAAADNNAVAVIDIATPDHSRIRGFIPTGWYPSAVCAAPDGKRLFIGSGKGMGTGANPPGKYPLDPIEGDRTYRYVGTLLYGMVSTVSVPNDTELASYTRQTLANTPYHDSLLDKPVRAPKPGSSPIPSRVGDVSPIKHVLYIIKENRTYDQVMGDIKKGNGDPRLTLFGEDTTPNIHALANEYVLLDNTYCNGDVSGNGHPWSTAAYGTDLGERAWMLAYSDKADWPLTDTDLYPPVGRIWDVCERLGVSWASYYFTWTTPNTRRHMPETWATGFDTRRDTENADVFIADLHKYEQDDTFPRFMIMSLREDHTNGTSPGSYTPRACVASNDQGVGKIIAALSRSKYWASTAVFIIQDDAQDGSDHVDAHRTEALVVSPYTRRGKVDSTFYTTTSLLRTMELILGLPPMSQYDAAAMPMYNSFAAKPDLTPYELRAPRIDLNVKNLATAYGAKESSEMDFSDVDRLTAAQVAALNRILWHSIKGENVPYPSPVRRALLTSKGHPIEAAKKASVTPRDSQTAKKAADVKDADD